jgi:phosphate-selective porin OprO/OprP
VHARYATMELGRSIFTVGFADLNLWSNQAQVIDIGSSWYPDRYIKVDLDWQHSIFGQPVFNGPGLFHRTADLLWLRFQLFF